MTERPALGAVVCALLVWGGLAATTAFAQTPSVANGTFIGDEAPDLNVCLNEGYRNLADDKGFRFKTERGCLFFAALGGNFSPALRDYFEVDFFLTNLTSKSIQLRHIQYDDSAHADEITFGVPSQWPEGVLPEPLSTPNWPPNTVLKLKFICHTSLLFNCSVDWRLNLKDLQPVIFQVKDHTGPGWTVSCSSSFADCLKSSDGIHETLVDPVPQSSGSEVIAP